MFEENIIGEHRGRWWFPLAREEEAVTGTLTVSQEEIIFCQDKLGKDGKEEATLESYILEIFDPTLPRYRMKKRLGDYAKFLDDEGSEWQEQTNTEQLPIVLFVCPRTSDLIYAKRRTRGLIAKAWEWEDDDVERPRMRFTTVEKLRQHGILNKEIWEQA